MNYTDKHIIESYTGLFEGLSASNKMELIESFSKSLKNEKKSAGEDFYNSFGTFSTDKSAEEIIKEIKKSRKFTKKEFDFEEIFARHKYLCILSSREIALE